jgi:histidine kinase
MHHLRNRLIASHLAVAAVGAATSALVVVWEAPAQFNRGMDGQGLRAGQQGSSRELFWSALREGLLLGTIAAMLAALVAALFIAVRLARPLEDVRAATHRISSGDYELEIPAPQETELAELVRDVNDMARRLRAVEGERVRLLGEVAHEMRTPLTVLTGRVEGLQDGVFTPDGELLAGLAGELRRLQRLADDLGTLSRVEERRLVLQPVPVDLSDLARRAVARFRDDPRAVGVELATEGGGSVFVDADVERLAQVLDNLIDNALRSVAGAGRIGIRVTGTEGLATLAVSDTGTGLANEDLERVFERFHRGVDARPEDGTGVGLTVSRGIAEAHGGTLVAESAGPGQGARFTLTLPRRAA